MTLQEEIKNGESRTLEYKAELPEVSSGNRTLARTFEKIGIVEGWGSGLKRIIGMCESYGVEPPQFIEIGDMLRVNFYRPSYKRVGDKPATTTTTGDKPAINASIGDNGKREDYYVFTAASQCKVVRDSITSGAENIADKGLSF